MYCSYSLHCCGGGDGGHNHAVVRVVGIIILERYVLISNERIRYKSIDIPTRVIIQLTKKKKMMMRRKKKKKRVNRTRRDTQYHQ
jgi:hypothetical protein